MSSILVAFATNSHNRLATHAGRAKHWEIYSIENQKAKLLWSIELEELGTLHEWHVAEEGNRHPLHSADYAIALSGGNGVRNRLAERNTTLITTDESEIDVLLTLFCEEKRPKSNQDEV